MKKILLSIAICSMFLWACKKNATELPDARQEDFKRHPVSFNVTEFSQTVKPLGVKAGKQNTEANAFNAFIPTETLFSKIMYVAYDSTGTEVSRLEQTTGESNKLFRLTAAGRKLINSSIAFGSLTDSLAAGNYTIVVTGGGKNTALNTSINEYGVIPYTKSKLADAKFYPSLDVNPYSEDAFLYKGKLTVGSVNKPQNIVLNRIVGLLALNFEDGIPAEAHWVRFLMDNNNMAYRINTNTPQDRIARNKQFVVAFGDNGKIKVPNTPLLFYVLGGNTPIDLMMFFVNVGGKDILTKRISNIMIQPNRRTLVTGKLMTAEAAFTITPNYAWDGQTVIKF